jgi:hypothetical protein
MKTQISRIMMAVTAVAVLSASGTAHAVCNQTSASQADKDLWNTHGCWQEFFLWQYKAYDARSSDWSNRGFSKACDNRFEYPKHWNSSYLVTYGLKDDPSMSFHGSIDYRRTAEAADSAFKDSVFHSATDDSTVFGKFIYHPFDSNEVQTSCNLYNATASNGHPAARAGDFMHEGWHGWMDKYDYDNGNVGGHRPGPQGACKINGCDYFYWHGLSAYAFGAMYQTDGTANRFHSPNQVQVEFLCDVADVSKSWVPASVKLGAKADANQRAAQRFINGPGYTCGSPRPW